MRWIIFNVLLFLLKWASSQTIYNANNFYKPMTKDFDVRHRGNVFLPPCMKELLNCWEVVGPEMVCKYRQEYRVALESICMDLRFHCTEHTGPLPMKSLGVAPWNYCPKTYTAHQNINLDPPEIPTNIPNLNNGD